MRVALLFRRRAFQTNMTESSCVVVECYEDSCFLVSIFSMTEIVPESVFIVKFDYVQKAFDGFLLLV